MLRSMNEVIDYSVIDLDNEVVGQVGDFFFDDLTWTVRYLVINTGVWLPGRRVLISPMVAEEPDWGGGVSLPIRLKKEQIENAPSVDADQPVSRQHEAELAEYYDWPEYWQDVTFLDAHAVGMHPEAYLRTMHQAAVDEAAAKEAVAEKRPAERVEDTHLRSVDEVTGYYIEATDGDIGHVEDFIFDTERWVIRYLVIDTKNWLPGKNTLVSPLWIDEINWAERKVFVDLTREAIKNSPEYNPSDPVNREYESQLYDYYGRPKYW